MANHIHLSGATGPSESPCWARFCENSECFGVLSYKHHVAHAKTRLPHVATEMAQLLNSPMTRVADGPRAHRLAPLWKRNVLDVYKNKLTSPCCHLAY